MDNESIEVDYTEIHKSFFKQADVKIVRSMTNGEEMILLYIALMIESREHNGRLMLNDVAQFDEEAISLVYDIDLDVVRSAFETFERFGWIEEMEDGIFLIKNQKYFR